jgi:putative membrane protein
VTTTPMLRASWTLALLIAGAAMACKGRDSGYTDTSSAAGAVGGTAASASAGASAAGGTRLTDANIAAILDAANASDSAFGALAVRKGRGADVKSFGRLMMGEHHSLRLQGQQLVTRLGVTPQPPANFELPNTQQTAMQNLEGKSGAEFDKAYIDHEVVYHEQVLQTAQQALGQAQNAELKALIEQAAPVIQKHLDEAKRIQAKLGSSP